MYFYDENFMLPLSHDEVVHVKSPMIYKMPGDDWQKFANLRLLYSYMFMHPGSKLLFMGNEFGQTDEWNYKTSLRWDLLQFDSHNGLKACVSKLNALLKNEKALHVNQFNPEGFEWFDLNHRAESVLSFKRKGVSIEDELLVFLNMTPVERIGWTVEINEPVSNWEELFNSDNKAFWGTGNYQNSIIQSIPMADTNKYKISFNLPPLGACVFKRVGIRN
jgi:1,4-alpha-glucan branching enzyme